VETEREFDEERVNLELTRYYLWPVAAPAVCVVGVSIVEYAKGLCDVGGLLFGMVLSVFLFAFGMWRAPASMTSCARRFHKRGEPRRAKVNWVPLHPLLSRMFFEMDLLDERRMHERCLALPSQLRELKAGDEVEVLFLGSLRMGTRGFAACLPCWKEPKEGSGAA